MIDIFITLKEELSCSLPLFKDKIKPKTCYGWFKKAFDLTSITGLDKLGRETVSDPMEFPVLESMIDVNRHMNNAHYVTHVFDWLSKKTSSVPELSEIQVNFIASTAPGAVLTAFGTLEEKKFYVECLQGGELHFQASGLLKE